MAQHNAVKPVAVPDLPEGLTWLNTSKPLRLDELRGKFVLLDFWTYCCINCMHILPELKELEKAYPKNLVVIGVHSAKFATERDTKNITEAILRHEIEHPVINDWEMKVWRLFGARSWPTVILIDPQGKAIWGRSGEITADQVRKVMAKAIPHYRKLRLLDTKPLKFQLEAEKAKPTPLRFPGKVLADQKTGRLFIADSNHNRIVITDLDGKLLETIGEGPIGRADGNFGTARFNKPQGMALNAETLYVADTENHLLRAVDLEKRTVRTIAGTGQQNRKAVDPRKSLRPQRMAINSPWALYVHDDHLYIAMAGPHQIWRMPLDESAIGPYAGNGREDIVDGRLLPPRLYEQGYSSFAQPSGLASDGKWLYVADSEGSSIRAVPFDRDGKVQTLVGTANLPGARLFTFGDVDGPPQEARLQHPLGIVFHGDSLYVADTYNSKIKRIDPVSGPAAGNVQTLGEGGKLPTSVGQPITLNEPAGITAAGNKLYVADTNNHRIVVVELGNQAGDQRPGRVSASVLSIPGLMDR
ncbi:MAG: thioredoxin-like domain-containing protein [Planctomycetota bacterium]|nr:thioredoxin-like domain-containing protein [Planctomycetota bacterium]